MFDCFIAFVLFLCDCAFYRLIPTFYRLIPTHFLTEKNFSTITIGTRSEFLLFSFNCNFVLFFLPGWLSRLDYYLLLLLPPLAYFPLPISPCLPPLAYFPLTAYACLPLPTFDYLLWLILTLTSTSPWLSGWLPHLLHFTIFTFALVRLFLLMTAD